MKEVRTYDIVCLVSNDVSYDRRMIRACDTLAKSGYKVLIVGRMLKDSRVLEERSFDQERVQCIFNNGALFYLELALRLSIRVSKYNFKKLLFVDLDTILVSRLLRKDDRLFYLDLHEYFQEVPELKERRVVKYLWSKIESLCASKCDYIYTVNHSLADIFTKKYQRKVEVVRNVPTYKSTVRSTMPDQVINTVYLGVLNPGRGLETLVRGIRGCPDATSLKVIGDGPLMGDLKHMANGCSNIAFTGALMPEEISAELVGMDIGWNLLDNKSQSYYYSLANKFFDYIMHGIPVVTMDFPEYRLLIDQYNCGLLLKSFSIIEIEKLLSSMYKDKTKLSELQRGCSEAASELNWENESQKLLQIFK